MVFLDVYSSTSKEFLQSIQGTRGCKKKRFKKNDTEPSKGNKPNNKRSDIIDTLINIVLKKKIHIHAFSNLNMFFI